MHLILFLSILNLSLVFSFEVGYSDYTDAYSRSEIEMMKNVDQTQDSISRSGSFSTNMEESENMARRDRDPPQNWYLLYLSGNTSIVHKRLPDFLNYLKINLGGLSDTQYENVTVNSISYVPSLIVNVSFSGNYSVSQLGKLSQRNDSVLVLSSVPFHLTAVSSYRDILIPKPFTNSLSTAREEEALLYLAVGAAIAFVLSAGVLVSILILVKKKDRIRDREPLIRQSKSFSRYQDPPQMIYSETFSQGIQREKERLHHFTPLDDNFVPVETEVDFVPRYIKDDERASWLSEGSILDTNGQYQKKNLSTFSDDGSDIVTIENDRRSQLSRSPFYWTLESQSPTPTITNKDQSLQTNGKRKKPPRPPSRTDSLNPRSTAKTRPQSSLSDYTALKTMPDIPTRRLSVPVPCHLSSLPLPPPSPVFPPAPALSQHQIDKDVDTILRNLDIVEEGSHVD